MKALTLRHPWGFCIAHLGKRIENRTWKPPAAMIGQRFAIHGGVMPRESERYTIINQVYKLADEHRLRMPDSDLFPLGIVATAVLDSVVTESTDPWFDGSGYGWVLRDVIVLPELIPCKGAQGLWTVPDDVLAKINTVTNPRAC